MIFGASGRTGHHLVEQALARGHEVTAFVRDRVRLSVRGRRLRVVSGDAVDASAVGEAVAGQDAVVSARGHARGALKDVQTVGTKNIVVAMKKHGAKRLVSLTGAGVRAEDDEPKFVDKVFAFLLGILRRDVLDDAAKHAGIVRASGLEWVVARGLRLTEGEKRGDYRVGPVGKNSGSRISRADLADFVLDQLRSDEYLGQMPVVSYQDGRRVRAIVVNETGPPDVLRIEEVEKPVPGPGEVLVEVAVAGVNFADVGMRAGMMGGPHAMQLPLTPGFEVAGTVVEVGGETEDIAEGDRVAAVLPAGGYAEYAKAAAESVVAVPDGVDFADASALLVQGLTAYGVLHDSARIREGEGVLVLAAGGGVGTLAVQLARLAGAGPVIGLAGSQKKMDLALSLGADHAFDYTGDVWVDEVLGVTGGRGVDVVLESVGGGIGARAYDCLAPLGRLVTFGAASGQGLQAPDMWQLNLKGQTVSGYGGPWIRPGAAEAARDAISAHLRNGELEVVKGASFPLGEAAEAHRAIEERRAIGKVLLTNG